MVLFNLSSPMMAPITPLFLLILYSIPHSLHSPPLLPTTDTAAQLSVLCRRIKREGAGRVFICASHGLFTGNSTELINLSPVEKVRTGTLMWNVLEWSGVEWSGVLLNCIY
jgi:hypothetical protein